MASRVPASPGFNTLIPPCRCSRTRSPLPGRCDLGVTVNAFTPAMEINSAVTPSASRSLGRPCTVTAAASSTLIFHSAVVSGAILNLGSSCRAIIACIRGLTVSGTGITRAGTSRVAADCAADCRLIVFSRCYP